MSTVDRLQRLIESARAQAAERKGKPERSAGGAANTGRAAQERTAGTIDRDAILAHVRNALSAAGTESGLDAKAAQRAFIESTLISAFGIEVANDPRFLELVEQVEEAMSLDPDVAGELSGLIAKPG